MLVDGGAIVDVELEVEAPPADMVNRFAPVEVLARLVDLFADCLALEFADGVAYWLEDLRLARNMAMIKISWTENSI